MGRIPANSNGDGRVYLGGNLFRAPDGSLHREYGYFTSPSGKRSYCDPSTDEIVTLHSARAEEIGTIYKDDKVVYKPGRLLDGAEILYEAKRIAAGEPMEKYIANAARRLGGDNTAD